MMNLMMNLILVFEFDENLMVKPTVNLMMDLMMTLMMRFKSDNESVDESDDES